MADYQLTQSGQQVQDALDQVAINESAITTNTTAIGTLSSLNTTEKGSLVGAVNEVLGDVGDLSSLTTTDKSNVVSAVNEVATDLRGGTLFKLVQYSASYTAAASASATLTASDFDASTPTGYTPIAVVQVGTGNGNVALRYINGEATGSSNMIGMRNVSTGSISASASIKILYVKVWGS